MSATKWFGDLQLAYKYIVVFLSLLVLTILCGFVKVLFDRRKLKKAKASELEAGPKEDTVELNQREKDEGDLFGIRAIEAGFYAGVAQSRPVSRANSVHGDASLSSSTLVGANPSSPLMKGQSANNSTLSLNLNAPRNGSKLRPSESAVDMNLNVPPSPGAPRSRPSFASSGSDSDGDEFASPRSVSPRSADFNPQHYTPAPSIPMPAALNVSYHDGSDNGPKSEAASFNNSPGASPTPMSHRNPPTAKLPNIPTNTMRKDTRSPSPPSVRVYQPNYEPSSGGVNLQPSTYAPTSSSNPTHTRDGSDASSIYSAGNRLSTFQAYQAYQSQAERSASAASTDSFNFSSTDSSNRTSMVFPTVGSGSASADKEGEGRRPSEPAGLLMPTADGKDSRLSEFYDVYYRNSVVPPQAGEVKRTVIDRHSTIMEVDSPMPSPLFPKTQQPGAAF